MKYLFLVAITVSVFAIGEAATLHVPGQYSAIQSGIDAASNGDTILVAPGTYHENIKLLGKRIVVKGSAGADSTTIVALAATEPVVQFSGNEPKGAVLQGFTITGSTYGAVWCNLCSPTIVDNKITGNRSTLPNNSPGISLKNTTGSFVSRNIIYSNDAEGYGAGIHVGDDRETNQSDTICYNTFYDNFGAGAIRTLGNVNDLRIYNNTIASADVYGILLTSTGTVDIRNNIINHVNSWYAIGEAWFFSAAMCAYNCLNSTGLKGDFNFVTEGPGNIVADPVFVDATHRDYRLMPNSPCIDAGDPSPALNDTNHTRNDIGAVPYNPPYLLGLNLGSEALLHVVNHTPTFYWNYLDPHANQARIQIEVGNEASWPAADMWQPGVIDLVDTFITYAGAPLVDGASYFVRIQVSNGSNWSQWFKQVFHVHSAPDAPMKIYPIAGETAPAAGLTLIVQSPLDPYRDSMKYDFELYQDQALSTKIDSLYGVPQRPDTTFATGIAPLTVPNVYWWRVRAFDGISYSTWSSPTSFQTRPPLTIHIPADRPSISSGLMYGGRGDTVLVSPGTYTESIMFPPRNMVLRSSDGAQRTTITSNLVSDMITFSGGVDTQTVVEGFTFSGGRMAIWCQNSAPTIRYNILLNQAAINLSDWGAISLSGKGWPSQGLSPAVILNNTIIGCTNAGIYSLSTTAPIIKNNIIVNNSRGIAAADITSLIVDVYNDVYGNSLNYLNVGPGAGTISLDPQFYTDHVLRLSSPCVNTGDPNPRYNDPDGSRNDMGAIPLSSCCAGGQMRGDLNGNGVVDLSDLSQLVAYLTTGTTIVPCLSASNVDSKGIVDLSDMSLLTQYLTGQSGVTLKLCSSVGP